MAPDAPRRLLLLFAALAATVPVFAQPSEAQLTARRRQMVNEQIADRGVELEIEAAAEGMTLTV